jgi:hypothetical protein
MSNAYTGESANFATTGGTRVMTFANGSSVAGTAFSSTDGSLRVTGAGYDITLPGANGATTYAIGSDANFTATAGGSNLSGSFTSGAESNLRYATYGAWETTNTQGNVQSMGVFAGGVPGAGVGTRPADGVASYSGKATGYASLAGGAQHKLDGSVSLTADFGANTVAGRVTGMTASQINASTRDVGAALATNDINLTAGLITGMTFAGQAMAAPGVAATQVSLDGAAGAFGGSFYGAGAVEAAGSISMTNPGHANIIASFGAAK